MSEQNNNYDFDQQDIEKNKVLAALAYLLFFIPLLACPESKFGKYHANQGLIYLITAIGGNIVLHIIAYFPFIGWIFALIISPLWGLLCFVLFVLGIVNAANGKAKELPVIGKYTLIK